MGLREGDRSDGQERRNAAVEDRRADGGEAFGRPLQGRTLGHEEGVRYVGAVVDAEADAYRRYLYDIRAAKGGIHKEHVQGNPLACRLAYVDTPCSKFCCSLNYI